MRMIISDKQELRRCVKQLVRRADVCEASLCFDMEKGELGVGAMLDLWARPAMSPGQALERTTAEQTPFSSEAAAMFAALQAMDLPVHDLNRADLMQREYDRGDYIREILDTMRAKLVLCCVDMDNAAQVSFHDERMEPLLCVSQAPFVPSRYGTDYAAAAKQIADAAALCGARNIALTGFDEQALCYCLMPLCEDSGFVLHMHLASREEIERFALLLDRFDGVRALVSCRAEDQPSLIAAAAKRPRMLVCLTEMADVGLALRSLGTRFAAYSARAVLPEQMLGRWTLAKEQIWQALCEAYLPLARAGYPLESAAIERDVRRILSGNLLELCAKNMF